jgi:uncharacterized protein (TIRG00374 family)
MDIKKILPIIGIVLLIYILSTLDIGKIIDVFLNINIFYGSISIFALIPILLLLNFEWQLILKKHNIKVSFWYSLKNIFIGFFYGFITPGGLGGYTRAFYLKDESGETIQKCFVNLLILSSVDFLALVTLGILGGFLLSSIFPRIFPIFVFIFILLLSLLIIFIRKDTGKIFYKKILKSRLLMQYKDKWDGHFNNLYEDIPKIKDLIIPFIVSIVGWFIWFSELYLISTLFSINVPFLYFILIAAIVNVIASLPITIQGLGTREGALILLLSVFNVPQENIIGFSLFWFTISWLFPSLVGTAVTIHETKRKPDISKTM